MAITSDAFLPTDGTALTLAQRRSLGTRAGPQKSTMSSPQAIAPLATRDAFKIVPSPTTPPWCAESNWKASKPARRL